MDFTGERYVPNLDAAEISYEHWHRYLYATQFVKNKVVLDIASGEGYGSDLLAKTAKKVVGVDISEGAIAHANKVYKKDNLKFLVGSVAKIPIEGKGVFDVIVSFETIEHVGKEDQKSFLEEVKRLLKPQGIFICSTPDKKAYSDLPRYKNEFHVKEFYEKEYKSFLGSYFKNIKILGQKIYDSSNIWDMQEKDKNFEEYFLEFSKNRFRLSEKNKDALYFISISSNGRLPQSISSFLTDLSDRRVVVRDGLAAHYMGEVERAKLELAKSVESLQNDKTELENKSNQIAKLETVGLEKDKKIEELNSVITEKNREIEELNGVVT